MNDAKLKEAIYVAQEAFWKAICVEYPEVTSGDFPPCATFAFDDACESALTTWLRFNKT